MKLRLLIFVACILLVTSSFACSETKKGHYFDVNGNPLPQYDFIFDELAKYFHGSVPEKITVVYTSDVVSMFNYRNQSVLINESSAKYRPFQVIGHESCHLCMERYTKGAGVKEQFRFFDEGFAFIFESIIAKQAGDYRNTSLKVAARQNLNNNVTFAKVQKWYEYFGNPWISINRYSYPVGSSFVYYVFDNYSLDSFLAFCKDIGDTYDLERSCRNIFGKGQKVIEAEWLDYLSKITVPTTPPHIVKMFPENNAAQISINTSEIYVEFDTPMDTYISLISDSEGVSYKNAYWKTGRILAVKVNLSPNHQYNLSLGRATGNKMMSSDGVELPPTRWSFATGSE